MSSGSKAEAEIRARARQYTEKVLFPLEWEVEENDGLSTESLKRLRQGVLDYELNAINHEREHGGQGMTIVQQAIVNEEIGKSTGALWVEVWQPAISLKFGTEEQKQKYLRPACRGQKKDCFMVSEPDAGSDAGAARTSATFRNGTYYLNGEKCFASGSDTADICLVHAILDGDPSKPTLFIVNPRQAGFKIKRLPRFTLRGPHQHPEVVLEDVEVPESDRLGDVGQGFELTKEWFVEARVAIGARCVGQATRATELANDWAARRVQFGKAIREFQAIEFMLADMAVEVMAAKSLLYRVAAEIDAGLDRKLAHAKVSAVKLFCSEMSSRVCDKALQIFGGRGYMPENAVERLWRDTRVERIWEGTSEIQKAIIGGQIKKRGLQAFVG